MQPTRASNLFLALVVVSIGAENRTLAATMRLKAVAVNDASIEPTDHVVVLPNDIVTVEAYVTGWNEDVPGSELVTYQFTIDGANSYFSGTSGRLLIRNVDEPVTFHPCVFDSDCAPFDLPCDEGLPGACVLYCTANGDCPPDFPICDDNHCENQNNAMPNLGVCDDDAGCGGPNRRCAHEFGLCGFSCLNDLPCPPELPVCHNILCVEEAEYARIDESRLDYVHHGHTVITLAVTHGIDLVFGSTTFDGHGPLDTGTDRYMGEFGLIASEDACGEFIVRIIDDGMGFHTFLMIEPAVTEFVTPDVEPLTIEVYCPPIAACCVPRQDCIDCTQSDCFSRGGTWQQNQLCGQATQQCPRLPNIRNPAISREHKLTR